MSDYSYDSYDEDGGYGYDYEDDGGGWDEYDQPYGEYDDGHSQDSGQSEYGGHGNYGYYEYYSDENPTGCSSASEEEERAGDEDVEHDSEGGEEEEEEEEDEEGEEDEESESEGSDSDNESEDSDHSSGSHDDDDHGLDDEDGWRPGTDWSEETERSEERHREVMGRLDDLISTLETMVASSQAQFPGRGWSRKGPNYCLAGALAAYVTHRVFMFLENQAAKYADEPLDDELPESDPLAALPSSPIPPGALPSPPLPNRVAIKSLPPPPTIVVTEPENTEDLTSDVVRIAAWADGLTANLGDAMDPATAMFLEQTVYLASQQAASARNPKVEHAISQLLRPKPLSCRTQLVRSLATLPTIWSLPLSPLLIPRPRRHGRSIPFCDFDGRKRPPGRVCASK
jgi:hypothetical protein